MRLIGILLALVILGYIMKTYLHSSALTAGGMTSTPQQTVKQAEDTVKQLNQVLGDEQKKLNDPK